MNTESLPVPTTEGNLLFFSEEAQPNGLAQEKSGKISFDKVLCVRITTPGDKSDSVKEVIRYYPEEFPHPVHGKIRKNPLAYDRFGKYIDEYLARGAGPDVVTGTPIEQWPMVDVRMAALLKHSGIYNVESLAMMSDTNATNIGMGVRVLVQKAKDWLQAATNSALAMEAQREKRAVQDQLDALRIQMETLADAFAELPSDAQAQVKASIAKRGKRKEAA